MNRGAFGKPSMKKGVDQSSPTGAQEVALGHSSLVRHGLSIESAIMRQGLLGLIISQLRPHMWLPLKA